MTCKLYQKIHILLDLKFWNLLIFYHFFAGLGVSLYLAKHLKIDHELLNPKVRWVQIFLSIAVTLSVESLKIPHQNEVIFYAGGFIKFFSMVNIIVVIIPYFFHKYFVSVDRIKGAW
jgi:hypothetical protein